MASGTGRTWRRWAVRRFAGPCAATLFGVPAGCASLDDWRDLEPSPPWSALPPAVPSGVRQAAHTEAPSSGSARPESLPPPRSVGGNPVPPAGQPTPAPAPFAGMEELTADAVVAQVLARNPTLAQMTAAAEAAAARYPQVTSLDDPMFGVSAAPAVWGSNQVNGGYRLEASQKLPFPGKLGLRGQNALAEARAAGNEVEDTRLELAEAAAAAFFDYYLAGRALDVNAEDLKRLAEFKQNAEALYKTGKAPQQDVNQADVEIGRKRERRVTLERAREVAVARINTLMHLPPDAPLPAPPKQTAGPAAVPDATALRGVALARRPDLKALEDRIAAEQAAVELARKEFGPDVEVMGAYDTFWQERPLRAQVGVRMNLPVRLPKRYAAIAEAQARVAQRRAELARLTDRVNYQVQEAAAQLRESERSVRLYEQEILPAAERNVKSAQAAYTAGQIPFLTLVEAQRNVVELRDRYYEAVAAYGRRRATLERVIGGPLTSAPGPGQTPFPAMPVVPGPRPVPGPLPVPRAGPLGDQPAGPPAGGPGQ